MGHIVAGLREASFKGGLDLRNNGMLDDEGFKL